MGKSLEVDLDWQVAPHFLMPQISPETCSTGHCWSDSSRKMNDEEGGGGKIKSKNARQTLSREGVT